MKILYFYLLNIARTKILYTFTVQGYIQLICVYELTLELNLQKLMPFIDFHERKKSNHTKQYCHNIFLDCPNNAISTHS